MNNSNSKNIASGCVEPPPAFLRLPQVQDRVGLARSSIYSLIDPDSRYHDRKFPKPIRIAAKAIGWLESEISAWIDARVELRNPQK
jgi:prophage regulatory protein